MVNAAVRILSGHFTLGKEIFYNNYSDMMVWTVSQYKAAKGCQIDSGINCFVGIMSHIIADCASCLSFHQLQTQPQPGVLQENVMSWVGVDRYPD